MWLIYLDYKVIKTRGLSVDNMNHHRNFSMAMNNNYH